ncbi:MAG: FKBP-type peptidyl-prolyl cis-trans isomerase [Rickettsiales bacterium]|nr:FKBP-type peptidyl-prolyl cis-trans isomerase [Rickettsiales bacterium]
MATPMFKPDPEKARMPKWMRGMMAVFLAYILFSGYQNEKTEETEPGQETKKTLEDKVPRLSNYPKIEEFVSVDRWHRILDPSFNKHIDVHEVVEGEGEYAACGQKVSIEAEALEVPGYQYAPEVLPEGGKASYFIGRGEISELWDRAVRGMRVGGERAIQVGARLVDETQEDPDAKDYAYKLKLTSLEPNDMTAKEGELGFSFSTHRKGVGVPASCGELVALKIRLWNTEGTLVHDTGEEPIVMRLGYGKVGHGIDRGAVGMTLGEIRRMLIPQAFLPKKSDIPFPKQGLAIVEVMRTAYKEEEETPKQE